MWGCVWRERWGWICVWVMWGWGVGVGCGEVSVIWEWTGGKLEEE